MSSLSTIIKEAENSVDKKFPPIKDFQQVSGDVFNLTQRNFKSFLTEQITKAVGSALEATKLTDLPPTNEELEAIYDLGYRAAVAEQAKKIERVKK